MNFCLKNIQQEPTTRTKQKCYKNFTQTAQKLTHHRLAESINHYVFHIDCVIKYKPI
ncbi:hypothetical protein M634_00005 [Vibrio parahaemolyticus O1:Kuk str. FDA_R31]|nr:hypothetical protein M634_00005 [Vibrio parahaemolyticus O1:Kuk str. FDA_R31]